MSSYIMDLRKIVGSRPLIACGACVLVINEQKKILLQRRMDNDKWGLPGGTLDLGETLEDTAKREVYEEVGLTCNRIELIGVFSGPDLYYRYPHGDEVYNVTVAYLCDDFSGTLRVDQCEARDARFFAVEELPTDINPPDRIVMDALRDLHAVQHQE